jgi:hypothetical protein
MLAEIALLIQSSIALSTALSAINEQSNTLTLDAFDKQYTQPCNDGLPVSDVEFCVACARFDQLTINPDASFEDLVTDLQSQIGELDDGGVC